MRCRILTAGVVAFHLWCSAGARADGAIMIAGKLSPREHDLIVDTIEAVAASMAWKLTAPPVGRETADAALACLKNTMPWGCVARGIRGNDPLVIVQVDGDRGAGAATTIVTMHVLTAKTPGEFFASRYCEVCTEEALKRAVTDLSKQLLQEAAERTGRTKLAIHSRPDKAWILLDGKTVGATNATRATYPGTHTIMLQHVGYKTAVREVVTVEGETLDVAFDMEPDPSWIGGADSHGPPTDHPPRIAPYVALGAGAAAIVTGALLIALDEDPRPRGLQRPYYDDTARNGAISLAIGAAVTGAGMYLLLRHQATPPAIITPLPGGAAANWTGRF
jgi:hypothetical protein